MILRSSMFETAVARQIAEEIASLSDLDANALVARWQAITRRTLPTGLKGELLVRELAYRMQEKVFGGLSLPSRKRLEQVDRESKSATSVTLASANAPRRRLMPGTRLVREWQGTRQEVIVIPDGFLWQGATYASLSTVARAITGTSWNGWVFFGARTDRRRTRKGNASVNPAISGPDPELQQTVRQGGSHG